jgi:hypothetical protein
MNNIGLVIPIDVEALCIGYPNAQSGTLFRNALANFADLPYLTDDYTAKNENVTYISEDILFKEFSGGQLMSAGVHLHWALPDALTRGIHDKDTIEYPAVPNRWLVTRLIGLKDNPTSPFCQESWIIESDALSKNDPVDETIIPGTTTIPVKLEKSNDISGIKMFYGQNFRYLGRRYKYEDWHKGQNDDGYLSKLTVIGYGEPTFAAFYPNCATVFGFYDSLDELEAAVNGLGPEEYSLMYHVVGWYSDPDNDPIKNKTPEEIKKELKWSFNEETTPEYSLYSGLVKNVAWDKDRDYFSDKPDNSTSVAVGNTVDEALAALLTAKLNRNKRDSEKKNSEFILNALQLGVLTELEQPGGLARYAHAIHQSYFSSSQGGQSWLIQPKEKEQNSQQVAITLPDAIADDLNHLNQLQRKYDELTEKVKSAQQQIFADWYKYMILQYPKSEQHVPEIDINTAKNFIRDKEVTEIDAWKTELNDLQDAIHYTKKQLCQVLKNEKDDYELERIPAPRYWQANDPVVLLFGDKVKPAVRYGGDGRLTEDGTLLCRLTNQLITAITVNRKTLSSNQVELPLARESEPTLSYHTTIWNLVAEAWLLGISQSAQSPVYTGIAPAEIGITEWNTPWLPFMLEWRVNYLPIQRVLIFDDKNDLKKEDYTEDFIKDKFKRNKAQTDLIYKDQLDEEHLQAYSGSVILNPYAKVDLEQQINQYLEDHENDNNLKEALGKLKNMPLLCQSFEGFNDALIMRKLTRQLPVDDPLADDENLYAFTNETVRNAVGYMNETAPLPFNNFNPIRAGYMQLQTLRLVGTFGRMLDIYDRDKHVYTHPLIAQSLQTTNDLKNNDWAVLSPRLTQPARLHFRWLSSVDTSHEMNSHPASSPILGWVIANYLDKNLVIYNSQGEALGTLQLIRHDGDKHDIRWQNAPGKNGKGIEEVFASEHHQLRDFAVGIVKNEAPFIKAMLDVIDYTLTIVLPQNDQQMFPLLIGRPLALVRASLNLDLQGRPAYDQSWQAFKAVVENGDNRNTAKFEQVQFPVWLGNQADINDGLVGYFMSNQEDNTNYQSFYTYIPDQKIDNSHIQELTEHPLLLNCDPKTKPTILTMLIDPQAKVQAMTGILPTKSIDLPPDQYLPALKKMAVTFLTAPILNRADSFTPIPENEEQSEELWSWIARETIEQQWDEPKIIEEMNQDATFPSTPQQLYEGWLKLIPHKETK